MILTVTAAGGVAQVSVGPGPRGLRGPGFTAAEVDANGHLILTGTDVPQIDAGYVRGPPGPGFSAAALSGNDLVITDDLGVARDIGRVVGPKGDKGDPGLAGLGLNNRGAWAAGTYQPNDFVFAAGSLGATSLWVLNGSVAYVSAAPPSLDTAHWSELEAPQGAPGNDGLGYPSALVDGSGHLVLTDSDGFAHDAGYVRGPPGASGALNCVSATAAGSAQGDATAIAGGQSVVVTAVAAGQGCVLPASPFGSFPILNVSATRLKVYPAAGQSISAGGVDTGTNLPVGIDPGQAAWFHGLTSTQVYVT